MVVGLVQPLSTAAAAPVNDSETGAAPVMLQIGDSVRVAADARLAPAMYGGAIAEPAVTGLQASHTAQLPTEPASGTITYTLYLYLSR